ncbi:MAG: hypothetical protein OEY22_09905 [Candidatus Bathyarchaeota archaeon]|nr:hypothetical protein [Candidatus Bathyarchaeota archaeon]MDH5787488.1 hypothetical protein [Candidatus Bathyarchaeota archaeon]
MHSKIRNERKTTRRRNLEVDEEAIRILRTVRDEEAFYFYEAFGKPIGENAKGLYDFLEKIKSISLESLIFHLQRKDFQNWIRNTLSDPILVKRIDRIVPSHGKNVRTKMRATIENRIKELKRTPMTLVVDENLMPTTHESRHIRSNR